MDNLGDLVSQQIDAAFRSLVNYRQIGEIEIQIEDDLKVVGRTTEDKRIVIEVIGYLENM